MIKVRIVGMGIIPGTTVPVLYLTVILTQSLGDVVKPGPSLSGTEQYSEGRPN